FRTASKAAPLVLGGYDQFHKRYVPCFRNISIPNPNPGRADAVISQDGSLDPRTECQRNTDIARFQPVFIEMPDGGTEISVGDVVFTNAPPRDAMGNITGSSTNPFNGDFRWYRVRTMSGVSFLYDTIWQISPNGDIINLLGGPGSVSTCASIFSTQVVRNDFGISSERFIDEFDACANGIVDSNAYFGCPLNADGTEQTCTINSGDIPLVNQVVYENRTDLVPSNRTGWYLTVQGRLQFAINLEKGVVIDVVDCREISLGRRQIQGSQSLVVDANESDFLRNQRLCSVNNSSITYFWNGTKEVPQTGETVFISNFENTVAPANRYLVFSNGLFVQLNAMSQV
ncbi:MAG: hypothetical protein MPJ22_14130, partial [Pirellulales bacterium]|nr:hypothetical protein [Pirellulales bacterium]